MVNNRKRKGFRRNTKPKQIQKHNNNRKQTTNKKKIFYIQKSLEKK